MHEAMPTARANLGRSSRPRTATAALAFLAVLLSASPAFAAKGCARRCGTDTTAPSVSIASPAAGSTVAGVVTVSGSASDNVFVSRVDVAVDGGTYQAASGVTGWTWTFDSTARADGSHTIAARATDSAGLTSTTSVTVAVSNAPPPPPADTTPPAVGITAPAAGATVSGTVAVSGPAHDDSAVARVDVAVDGGAWSTASGTTAWTWSWSSATVTDGSHTLTARATDTSGNTVSAGVTVTVANATPPPPPPGPAPNTQGSWVSPEGVHINVASAGPWTISSIYSMLKANALELDAIGPSYTVNVQDTTASQTVTSASSTDGVWGDFGATTYLKGVSSTFANQPDAQLAYEYGGAWSRYHLYITHARDWTPYLTTRWSSPDGSVKLGQDSRLNSTLAWSPGEMICDDYRLLFGSALAVSERPAYLNPDVVDPRNQPGLRDWFLTTWA